MRASPRSAGSTRCRRSTASSLVERGSSMQIGQSMTPDSAPGAVPYEESIAIDRRRGRMAVDTKVEYSYGPYQQFRMIDGVQGYRLNHAGKTVRPMAASEHQVLLRSPAERAAVRAAGGAGSRPHAPRCRRRDDRRAAASRDQRRDRQRRRCRFAHARVRSRDQPADARRPRFYADPLFGDTTLDTLFTGYATRGAHKLPGGRLVRRAGQVATRVDYVTLEINPAGLRSAIRAAGRLHDAAGGTAAAAQRRADARQGRLSDRSGRRHQSERAVRRVRRLRARRRGARGSHLSPARRDGDAHHPRDRAGQADSLCGADAPSFGSWDRRAAVHRGRGDDRDDAGECGVRARSGQSEVRAAARRAGAEAARADRRGDRATRSASSATPRTSSSSTTSARRVTCANRWRCGCRTSGSCSPAT